MPQCKRCGADIEFKRTEDDKNMPVEAKSSTFLVKGSSGKFRTVEFWRPHWATCPGAEEFRKKT